MSLVWLVTDASHQPYFEAICRILHYQKGGPSVECCTFFFLV